MLLVLILTVLPSQYLVAQVLLCKTVAEAKNAFLNAIYNTLNDKLPGIHNLVLLHDLAQQPDLLLDCLIDFKGA